MLRRVVIGCLLFALPIRAEEKTFSQTLSAAELNELGLHKLTDEELGRLDERVAKAQRAAATAAATTAGVAAKPAAPEILRGKIAGVLTGWSEGTVLVLEDGQRWQVVSQGSYRAAPVRREPKLQLFPLSNGDYIMTIDTVPKRAQVRRVTE